MRHRSVGTVTAGLLVLLAGTLSAQTQEPTRVEQIRESPEQFRNEVVTVEGRVTQYVERPAQTTSFYFIQDDWGSLIQVRTTDDLPSTGQRYRVTGAISFDERGEPFITEDTREPVDEGGVGPGAGETPGSGASEEVGAQSNRSGLGGSGQNGGTVDAVWWQNGWILAAGGVVVLLVLFGVGRRLSAKKSSGAGAAVRRESPGGAHAGGAGAGSSGTASPGASRSASSDRPTGDTPEPAEVVEGKTVRFEAPPSGTLKLMPGRLELVSGDEDVDEVRFFDPGRDGEPEFTFGRESGPRYTHIQLSAPTVSRQHAKISFSNGEPKITNLSGTNPTRVNQVELEEEGATAKLEDGDVIDMGEIRFRFHQD